MKILLASLLTLGSAALYAAVDVYPTPHSVVKHNGMTVLGKARISGTFDNDARDLLKTLVQEDGTAAYAVHVAEGGSARAGLKPVSGAYRLKVSSTEISICSYDAAGTFYAVQTLSQMVDPQKRVPLFEIEDYPDIPFRGTVEGFYGKPWPHQDRLSQFDFYGKVKLNTYIYGPKDDPFHGFSTRWREPYPPKEAERIRELVVRAKKNKVNFVWAVHPGRDIRWTDADFKACLNKFEKMYELGVRSFGVFFDDIGGEGAKAEGQIEFLNGLNREFIQKKKDVTPLIMCPTQYNRSWSGGNYLPLMGERLDSTIDIMWTGNSVVHNITLEGNLWVKEKIKRSSYIWWNWPVSDYVRTQLLIGRTYGLDQSPEAVKSMSGFVSNPMDKPEASKIPLFSIADYTWNIQDFNSEKSWKAGIKRLFPDCAKAMQLFANHNSDPAPNGHGYRREESVDVAPVMERFLAEYRSKGTFEKADFDRLTHEFNAMTYAPGQIRKKVNNPDLLAEISPWLNSFERLGAAGFYTLKLLPQTENQSELQKGFELVQRVVTCFNTMKSECCSEDKAHNPGRPPVKTGSLVVTPFVTDLFKLASAKLAATASGLPLVTLTPITSSKQTDGIDKMLDRDPGSYFYCREIQKEGDWFGVDLGSIQPIRNITILMGRQNGDHDRVHKGQLEISSSGEDFIEKWTPVCAPTEGEKIELSNLDVSGRYIRYRVLKAGKLDGSKNDVWTAIRDFSINSLPLPAAVSTVEGIQNPVLQIQKDGYAIGQVHEVHPMVKGAYFELVIPEGVAGKDVRSFEVDLDVPEQKNWGDKRVSSDGKSYIPLEQAEPEKNYMHFRFTQKGDNPQNVKIKTFKLLVNDTKTYANALDHNPLTSVQMKGSPVTFENKDAVECSGVVLVGDFPDGKLTLIGANGQTLTVELNELADMPYEVKDGFSPVELKRPAGARLGEPIKKVVIDPENGELTLNEIFWVK